MPSDGCRLQNVKRPTVEAASCRVLPSSRTQRLLRVCVDNVDRFQIGTGKSQIKNAHHLSAIALARGLSTLSMTYSSTISWQGRLSLSMQSTNVRSDCK